MRFTVGGLAMIGQTLGHYRIVEKLGEGGMGVVYKADDTHLDRPVAIKVLRPETVANPERKRRFVQEAKAASALNHPNILHIYDIDQADGVDFIAMEFVAGKTLDHFIGHNGLPVAEALRYAVQVADALAAAHGAGIVHRDLKPANLMVTENGIVKVLDFGLAKLTEAVSGLDDLAATLSAQPATQEGVILGSVAYMSPEQAEGRKVDPRSDIFSFGSVLYEMVTGQRAFSGQTSLSTLTAILHQNPRPVGELAEGVPPDLQKIILRCLRKDPESRFQHMGDVKVLLRELLEESGRFEAAGVPPPEGAARVPASGWRRRILPAAAVAAALLFGVALGFQLAGRKKAGMPLPPRKFQFEIQSNSRDVGYQDMPLGPVLSPDGTMVVYAQDEQLWIRDLNRLKPREIPETQGAQGPFWSPESDFIAYVAGGVLKKVPAQGGPSMTICQFKPARNFLGGVWGPTGFIVVGIAGSGLYEVSTQGGELKPVVLADHAKGEEDFHSPRLLPDGRTLLYVVHTTLGYQSYVCARSRQGSQRVLPESAGIIQGAIYSPSGHLIYERVAGSRTILAVPFSLSSLSPAGEPFVVAEDAGHPSISRDGTLLYYSSRPEELVMVDRTGKVERDVSPPYEQIRFPALSPDGQRVALSGTTEGNLDVWVCDLVTRSRIRLTADAQMDISPAWTPSGDQVAFSSGTTVQADILSARSDGGGEQRRLVSGADWAGSPEWAPDGKHLVYLARRAEGGNDIWILPSTGDRQARPFLATKFDETNPRISPDGRYIAYASNESGQYEVYVKPFPQGESRWLVSVNGGTLPRWNRHGHELFYVARTTLMVVPIETQPAFRAGTPRSLFNGDDSGIGLYSFGPTTSAYDVAADGQHFVAVRRSGGTRNLITIVQNWLADFEGRSAGQR